MRIIAIEEHFSTPMARANPIAWPVAPAAIEDARRRSGVGAEAMLDLGEIRLKAMDEAGIDLQVISLGAPSVQGHPAELATAMARDSNDRLFEAVKQHPTRFAGFAAIPTVDPAAAVKELERAVKTLGFKGTLINGRSVEGYLDDKKYWPIFEAAEALDTAIYLHPREPHKAVMDAYFQDYWEVSNAAWGFGVETGTHWLRIMLSGVFDRFPKLKLILGHLGEGIPFWLPRLDEHARGEAKRRGLKKTPAEYVADHLLVTTSGHFSNPAFRCTAKVVGIDNILFAVDWPHESNKAGVAFLDQLPVAPGDREKIAHGNAERILGL